MSGVSLSLLSYKQQQTFDDIFFFSYTEHPQQDTSVLMSAFQRPSSIINCQGWWEEGGGDNGKTAAGRWMASASSWERKKGPVLAEKKKKMRKYKQPTKWVAPSCFSAFRPIKRGHIEVEVKLYNWDLPCLCFCAMTRWASSLISPWPGRQIKKGKKRKLTVFEWQGPIAVRDKIRLRRRKTARVTRAVWKKEPL